MGDTSEQSDRVIGYYRKTAQDYDKDYEAPYWKELYDKITWHYIEPYLPKKGLVQRALPFNTKYPGIAKIFS